MASQMLSVFLCLALGDLLPGKSLAPDVVPVTLWSFCTVNFSEEPAEELGDTPVLPAVGYEVPDGPKEEPGDSVGHDEDEERAAPVEVHQGGEDVGQVAVGLLHVPMLDVTAAVLLHVALPLTPSPGCKRDSGRLGT